METGGSDWAVFYQAATLPEGHHGYRKGSCELDCCVLSASIIVFPFV